MIRDLTDIIGMECTHNFSEDLSYWNEHNTIRCRVFDVDVDIDDKPPYRLNIYVCIEPIADHNLDQDDVDEMGYGVCIESIVFN